MKWTNKQQEAIDLRDHNILVSAAAGSGKTAVLVERIKQLIIEDKISLDQFLIVTFTNAAAAEMKEKLITAITHEIEENPNNASFLRKQLDLAGSANISTFHSFALEVIRRYFYLTDIEPNFKIGDEGAVQIIKWDTIDQLFVDCFEESDPAYFDFLKAYASDRNERALKENILKLYSTIQSIPHPLKWLHDHVESLNMDMESFQHSDLMDAIKEDLQSAIPQILSGFEQAGDLAQEAGIENIYQKNQEDLEKLQPLLGWAREGNLKQIGSLLSTFKANVMRAKKEEKEDYELIKSQIKDLRDFSKKIIINLKERYFNQDIETYIEDLQSVYPSACYLEKMMIEFDQQFRAAKQEKNIIDFNDIEHYALEILEHEEAAQEYREKFACIFIDEYQDSNVLQDTLIHKIKRDDNLFMVGDIKQSIYKFRLAEPEIFQAKYQAYGSGEIEKSTKVDLNQNFRSKSKVIASVNGVFKAVMKGYDNAAALYQGISYDGPFDYKTQLHVVDSRITEDMELDEEIAEMKNAQLEAYNAVEIIKDILGNPIFDIKQNCERPITKRDIVILMRATKNYADVFLEVFSELDIPAYVDDSSGYFDTVEIEVFLNLLKVIDNKRQDLPLLSVMRSAVFDFTIEDLIQIRLHKKQASYFEAVLSYSKAGEDLDLRNRCLVTFEKLKLYREMAQALPLEEFIWKLMWDTGYYTYCGALPAGQQRQANLRALADKARDFQETGYSGIYGFLTYIQALEKRSVPMGQVKLINERDDIVRIMTIHKSKGLEFPVVIVAGLGKQFNFNKTGKGFVAHKDLGLGLTRVEHGEHWYRKTLMQTAIERKLRQEELEEQIRILYVAFTRAMDQLILLGTSKKVEEGIVKPSPSKNCFLDYLIPLTADGQMELSIHDRTQLNMDNQQRNQNKAAVRQLFHESGTVREDPLFEEIDRRLSFKYEYQQALSKKSKYSVTELSRMDGEHEEPELALKAPDFMHGTSEFTAAQRGTIMHKVMECIDFKEAAKAVADGQGQPYVKRQVERMQQQELLLPEEAESVDCDKIKSFFLSDIGLRAAAAERLYKETEFNLLKKVDGTEVMVQGIIDCYFEEEDYLILVDYKNSYINQKDREAVLARLKETYKGQIAIYQEALEAIRQKKVKEAYLYLFSENDCIGYHTNNN